MATTLVVASGCVGSNQSGQELRGKGERRSPNGDLIAGTVAANQAFSADFYRAVSSGPGSFPLRPEASGLLNGC